MDFEPADSSPPQQPKPAAGRRQSKAQIKAFARDLTKGYSVSSDIERSSGRDLIIKEPIEEKEGGNDIKKLQYYHLAVLVASLLAIGAIVIIIIYYLVKSANVSGPSSVSVSKVVGSNSMTATVSASPQPTTPSRTKRQEEGFVQYFEACPSSRVVDILPDLVDADAVFVACESGTIVRSNTTDIETLVALDSSNITLMRQHADLVFVGTLSGSVYSVAAAALAEGLVALDLVYEHPNGSPVTALGYWPPTNTLVSGHRDGSVFDSQSSNCTLVYPAIDNMTSQVLDLKPAPMALSWLALYVDGVVEWQIDAAATSAEARIVKSRALPELVSLDVHPHEQQVAVIDRHGQVFVLNSTDFDLLQSWYLYSPSTSSSSSTLATDNSSDNSSDSSSASNNNDADGGSIDAGNSTEPAAAFVAGASADATTVTSETTTAAAATSTAVAVTITSAPPTAEAVLQTAVIESSDPFGAASVSDNSFAPYPSTSHHERLVYILYQSMQSLIYQWDSVAGNCLASPVSIPSRVASLKFSKRQQLLWIGLENGLVAHLTLPSQC